MQRAISAGPGTEGRFAMFAVGKENRGSRLAKRIAEQTAEQTTGGHVKLPVPLKMKPARASLFPGIQRGTNLRQFHGREFLEMGRPDLDPILGRIG